MWTHKCVWLYCQSYSFVDFVLGVYISVGIYEVLTNMYNGIGLPTARGSGTNGYVQRNWAFVRKSKDKVNYKTEEELEKLEATSNRQPNRDILDHERKRKVEVKCIELEDILEDQGWVHIYIYMCVCMYALWVCITL